MNIRAEEHSKDILPTTNIKWIPIKEVLKIISRAQQHSMILRDGNEYEVLDIDENSQLWTWTKNTECKYIELRIDMRDGRCIIRNRDGELISLEELKSQINF